MNRSHMIRVIIANIATIAVATRIIVGWGQNSATASTAT